MIFIDFYFKHSIGERFQYLPLNLNLILFWHNILSLTAGFASLVLAYILALSLRFVAASHTHSQRTYSFMHLRVQKGSSSRCCNRRRIIAYFPLYVERVFLA